MPFVRFLVFKRHICIIAVILLLSKIMPTYSCYMLKELVCVVIIAPLGRQPSFYTKCTKLNIRSSCNIRLISNTECACLIYSYIL